MGFRAILLCALLAVAHSRHLVPKFVSRIVGGDNAFPGQFPYQVSLQLKWEPFIEDTHFCGGTIINERWILTAGHCVGGYEELPSVFTLVVKAGKYNLSKKEIGEQVADVEKYFKHELYHEVSGAAINDIGLIKLRTPLKLDDLVAKAVLPKNNSEPVGQVTLSGWGSITEDPEDPINPEILQTVTVPIVDRKTCNAAIRNILAEEHESLNQDLVLESNVCTGPLTGGISACSGDSGSPLATTNDKGEAEVVGIASWVLAPCGRKGAPSVYVRVSSYIDWINDTIRKN